MAESHFDFRTVLQVSVETSEYVRYKDNRKENIIPLSVRHAMTLAEGSIHASVHVYSDITIYNVFEMLPVCKCNKS